MAKFEFNEDVIAWCERRGIRGEEFVAGVSGPSRDARNDGIHYRLRRVPGLPGPEFVDVIAPLDDPMPPVWSVIGRTETPLPSDLTEFLLARIADDEAATRTASSPFYRRMFNGWHRGEVGGAYIGFTDRFTPERVLLECEAKRRIVEVHGPVDDEPDGWCILCDGDGWPCSTMASLASVYADHPDYREEWRP